MNKSDWKLLGILVLIVGSMFLFLGLSQEKGAIAYVYSDGTLVLTIDLSLDNTYQVQGALGPVKIVVKDKKIKVEEENSPRHLCSKQGFVGDTKETIICLPNKVVIELSKESSYDSIVK